MSNSFRIVSASVSDRGLSEKRPQNEDSFLEIGPSGIFAVADGVGGASAGEVASQMAMEILGEAFTNLPEGADAEEVMREALEQANAAIHQMSDDLPSLSSMATTVVALHITGDIATIGHVGDSRLYRVDGEGNLHRETDDHSVVAEEVRAGRMTEEQAENHPSRNIISRALGAESTVEIELKTMMFDAGTSFLICSDGVTRHVTDPEIRSLLDSPAEPSEIVEQIRELCFERGAEDNLTAVIVRASADMRAANEIPLLTLADAEEPTIAAARSPFESKIDDESDEDELLELNTRELTMPEEASQDDEILETHNEPVFLTEPTSPFEETAGPEIPVEDDARVPETTQTENFSMFGDSGLGIDEEKKPNTFKKIVSGVGLLLLGGVLGLAGYHFLVLPALQQTSEPQITEMKSANIPLTAFEENRRNVDKDPAAYVARVQASPQQQPDSSDFYLLGRAYMLLGDYPKARAALIESRNRLAYTEPANVNVLTTDIAMALAVTNEPTIQNMLKKELEATKPGANANTPTNANVKTNANR